MQPTITVTPEQVVAELLVFVSQHSEYRWHREDLKLYTREVVERDEARNALTKFVNGEVPTYAYNDYLWGACTIYHVGGYALVVRVDSNEFSHNEQLTDDLQQRIAAVFKGWSRPPFGNPRINPREACRLGRVQPIRVHSNLNLDPGTWYAFGPDVIFHVVDWRHQGPFWSGKVHVFSTPTGKLDEHEQPFLTITIGDSEDALARYGKMAASVDDQAKTSASVGINPGNTSVHYR